MPTPTPSTDISAPTTLPPSIKVRYIRDTKNSERVLTLVTRVEGDKLSFAVSVNSPPRTVAIPQENGIFLYNIPGDRFSRKEGSRIALARLACARSHKEMTFDPRLQHPLILALHSLIECKAASMVVARIALAELRFLATSAPELFSDKLNAALVAENPKTA